ncbi:hypothetical protein B0H10DRAFT_1792047 [Mycena sp. CBHHK59/15]|nr:hypothetical protein B0H10DRAFT_1792047 [Mycena sp. CBHHK59/15]
MAPSPQCSALAAAKDAQTCIEPSSRDVLRRIATKLGKSEQHVIDICTGTQKPTNAEFNALANVLGIKSEAPHNSAHATT